MEIRMIEPESVQNVIPKIGKYVRVITMYLFEVEEGVAFSYLVLKIFADFLLDIWEVKPAIT